MTESKNRSRNGESYSRYGTIVFRIKIRRMNNLKEDLRAVVNRNNAESGSCTPDFILAEYIDDCLAAFDAVVNGGERSTYTNACIYALDKAVARRRGFYEDSKNCLKA